MMQNSSVHICFLIGANCFQALETIKIISSEVGKPYVNKIKLECGIVGQICWKNDDRCLKCNKIAVEEVISDNVVNYHCETQKKI